jgi:plasmid maintenance system killer protein
LRRFVVHDDPSGIPPATVHKIRNIVSFLQDMRSEEELRAVPAWKAHQLAGNRKQTWSLHVTRNWRITFQVDRDEIEILNLDFEDYH